MSSDRVDSDSASRRLPSPWLAQLHDPDQPTRVTVYEPGATGDALMTRWITVDECALVDVIARR